MALQNTILRLLADPPPDYVFEVSEAGIAHAQPFSLQPAFAPLEPGILAVSPLADNVLRPEAFADAVRAIVPAANSRKRRRAALILPDFCARVAVLEFDSFPTDAKEQLALVRFRMKKSIPFDIESAVVGYHVQGGKGKKVDVVVVVIAMEIVARYEAPFRAAGLHTGFVTASLLAMSELNSGAGISVLARIAGSALTVAVMQGGLLKLVRCVELADGSHHEILNILFPTIAYVEDEMGARPDRLSLCGFPSECDWQTELGVAVHPLTSRLGTTNEHNAGLLGYLESTIEGTARVA